MKLSRVESAAKAPGTGDGAIKQVAPLASLLVALISIAGAMFAATQYFATREQLDRSVCRERMLREQLEFRMDIKDIDERMLVKSEVEGPLALEEGANPASSERTGDAERLTDLNQELRLLFDQKTDKQARFEEIDKWLREGDILTASGECRAAH